MSKDTDRNEQALLHRDQDRPLVGIGEILELDDARAAKAAFNRDLRGRPNAEQEWLRRRAMARLDGLASRVRRRDDLSVEEVVRRLRDLEHQRKTLVG